MLLIFLLTNLSLILGTIVVLGIARTTRVQNDKRQKLFLAGKLPTKAPDGIYKGTVKNIKTTWIGKAFNAKDSSGINNFSKNGKTSKSYRFKTYIAHGIQDKEIEVLKIDYNIPGNPLWLRLILDEIVETEPNSFLGKVHLRLLPGIAFTLGYFQLEK